MIKSFKSKVLKRAFEKDDYKKIDSKWKDRIDMLLDALDAAESTNDLALPSLGTHPLKGARKGEWAMSITGNWRMTFRFEGGDAYDVDMEDYH